MLREVQVLAAGHTGDEGWSVLPGPPVGTHPHLLTLQDPWEICQDSAATLRGSWHKCKATRDPELCGLTLHRQSRYQGRGSFESRLLPREGWSNLVKVWGQWVWLWAKPIKTCWCRGPS